MDKLTVLLVPFSGGGSNNLFQQALNIGYLLEDAGMRVQEQKPHRLRRLDLSWCCDIILQIGIGVPPEHGLACLAELRLIHKDTPIVVISEHGEEYMAQQVNLVANAIFLHRPFGGNKVLVETVKSAIEQNKTAPSE